MVNAVIISAQENYVFPVVADHTGTDVLFSGVSGRELSSSEMKQNDGKMGIILGAIAAITLGSMYYKAATGRDFLKDVHRYIVKPVSRTIRRARDYGWRRRIYSGSW